MNRVVLIAVHWLELGGAEKFVVDTIKYAHARGWFVYCWIERKRDESFYFKDVYSLVNQFFYAEKQKDSASQFEKLVKSLNPTLLHIHHSTSAYLSLPNIYHYLPKIIDTTHIIEHHYYGGYPYLSVKYSPFIDVHHVISKGLKQYYLKKGVNERKVKLAYLNEIKKSNKLTPIKFKEHWTVGFLGRFEQQKRPELFLKLARHLQAKSLDFEFIMQGSGTLKTKCIKYCHEVKLKNFKFLDSRSDIESFFNKVDVLVLPSNNEGLALVNFEATYNNTLVISSDVGQQSELTAPDCLVNSEENEWVTQASNIIETLTVDSYLDLLKCQLKLLNSILLEDSKIDLLDYIYG